MYVPYTIALDFSCLIFTEFSERTLTVGGEGGFRPHDIGYSMEERMNKCSLIHAPLISSNSHEFSKFNIDHIHIRENSIISILPSVNTRPDILKWRRVLALRALPLFEVPYVMNGLSPMPHHALHRSPSTVCCLICLDCLFCFLLICEMIFESCVD